MGSGYVGYVMYVYVGHVPLNFSVRVRWVQWVGCTMEARCEAREARCEARCETRETSASRRDSISARFQKRQSQPQLSQLSASTSLPSPFKAKVAHVVI